VSKTEQQPQGLSLSEEAPGALSDTSLFRYPEAQASGKAQQAGRAADETPLAASPGCGRPGPKWPELYLRCPHCSSGLESWLDRESGECPDCGYAGEPPPVTLSAADRQGR
jgi:hypothetical protein